MIYVVWYQGESGKWYAFCKHYVRLATAEHRCEYLRMFGLAGVHIECYVRERDS